MGAIFLACGVGGPQLKRNPLDGKPELSVPYDAHSSQSLFAKLTGLSATLQQVLSGDIRYTGSGLSSTEELVNRFTGYREELREALPQEFGDIPKRRWSSSIASQKDTLRGVQRDLREILTRAAALGIITMPQASVPVSSGHRKSPLSWLAGHAAKIIIALLIAYLIYRFGWNR